MSDADPRLTPARPDLAAADLEGVVRAARYAPRRPHAVIASSLTLSATPGGARETQLLFGERFDVLEVSGGHAWGQASRDGYVGWVPTEGLAEVEAAPTHRVTAPRAAVFSEPSVRGPVVLSLVLNALVHAEAEADGFIRASGAGWMPSAHLRPIWSDFASDPVAVAETLLGAPYVWGGRDVAGLDCSALVQASLFACGRACPRDSDQQEAALGRPLAAGETPRRGDLAFFDGHVGWLVDSATLLHANSFHMAVVSEPLAEAATRGAAGGRAGSRFRRLTR